MHFHKSFSNLLLISLHSGDFCLGRVEFVTNFCRPFLGVHLAIARWAIMEDARHVASLQTTLLIQRQLAVVREKEDAEARIKN